MRLRPRAALPAFTIGFDTVTCYCLPLASAALTELGPAARAALTGWVEGCDVADADALERLADALVAAQEDAAGPVRDELGEAVDVVRTCAEGSCDCAEVVSDRAADDLEERLLELSGPQGSMLLEAGGHGRTGTANRDLVSLAERAGALGWVRYTARWDPARSALTVTFVLDEDHTRCGDDPVVTAVFRPLTEHQHTVLLAAAAGGAALAAAVRQTLELTDVEAALLAHAAHTGPDPWPAGFDLPATRQRLRAAGWGQLTPAAVMVLEHLLEGADEPADPFALLAAAQGVTTPPGMR